MIVTQNSNYTIHLNPNDIGRLMKGQKVTFWICDEERDDLTFELIKE